MKIIAKNVNEACEIADKLSLHTSAINGNTLYIVPDDNIRMTAAQIKAALAADGFIVRIEA